MTDVMQEPIEQIKNIEAAIEAILYAAGHPVEYDRLHISCGGAVAVDDLHGIHGVGRKPGI